VGAVLTLWAGGLGRSWEFTRQSALFRSSAHGTWCCSRTIYCHSPGFVLRGSRGSQSELICGGDHGGGLRFVVCLLGATCYSTTICNKNKNLGLPPEGSSRAAEAGGRAGRSAVCGRGRGSGGARGWSQLGGGHSGDALWRDRGGAGAAPPLVH
jgi:hypothetical protein